VRDASRVFSTETWEFPKLTLPATDIDVDTSAVSLRAARDAGVRRRATAPCPSRPVLGSFVVVESTTRVSARTLETVV